MKTFLKKIPLFANLSEDDLDHLNEIFTEESLSAGELLFSEGEIGNKAYVITAGEIDVLKAADGKLVLLATLKAGEVIGEMSLLEQTPRLASGRARTDSKLVSISHADLDHLLETSPSAAKVMLSTIIERIRNNETILRQSEKMAHIGNLTEGLAHELYHPAVLTQQSAELLGLALELYQQSYLQFYKSQFTPRQLAQAAELSEHARKCANQPADLNSRDRGDRAAVIEAWLDERQFENSRETAQTLVSLAYRIADLEELEVLFPDFELKVILQWLCTLFHIHNLLDEICQGASRIGEIVKSLKSYVYLDQAPIQSVNIHDGLNTTLVMLNSKMNSGIKLERHYAKDLPQIMAYASELNQVWTNLIETAVDSMAGDGNLKIRTHQEGGWVFVDFEDSGVAVPEEVQPTLFSPFFTANPMEKRTLLGLNISSKIIEKHKGKIKVSSQPGRTCFSVGLPINFEKIEAGPIPLPQVGQFEGEVSF